MIAVKTIARRLSSGLRNRKAAIFAGMLLAALAGWAAYQEMPHKAQPMAAWMPAGAMLYIESPDFASLLHDWNASREKQTWLRGDNYAVFSRSRLFGRLGDAQQEFAAAAGLPPNMQFLTQIAGKESALGLYDIGALQFLYITHIPNADALQTGLLQERGKFATRKSGDTTFYVSIQADSDQGGTPRTVAFATFNDYLLLATREDILAKALGLMQGKKQEAVSDDGWFTAATAAAAQPGDLRMVLDLSRIVPSPYFRSYWIQQNVTEMGKYRAAVSDLYRSGKEYREERVLLPKSADNSSAVQADLGQLTALIPPQIGFYRAVAAPSIEEMIATLDGRLLSRKTAGYKDLHLAPAAADSATTLGGENDLETRIDAPPVVALPSGAEFAALRKLLQDQQPQSMLLMDSSDAKRGDIFVAYHSAIVLASQKAWNAQTVELALQQALSVRLSTGDLGLGWRQQSGAAGYSELDGMQPLQVAVSGRYCILANDTATLNAVLQRIPGSNGNKPAGQSLVLISGFNHLQERANFTRATSLIDFGSAGGQGDNTENSPHFFSKNIKSVSDTFSAIQSEQISMYWMNSTLHQTVRYTWKPMSR